MATKPPPLVWADGRPIDFDVLKRDVAGPRLMSTRSIYSGHPSQGLTPPKLAELLIDAEQGNMIAYLELAEEIEEKEWQYASVLGTRKRAVAQEPIEVLAADDSAEAKDDAAFIRDWLQRDTLEMELFDVLDAIGKGFSFTEIIWETTSQTWLPAKLARRDPRWFRFDQVDGETPMLWTEQGFVPLAPYKFINHFHPGKSGIPVRGGLARPAAWAYMFKTFGVKEWLAFIETYGQPLRVGRYDNGEAEENVRLLMRAVSQVGQDAAAVFPKSMDIEFIQGGHSGSKGDPGGMFKSLAEYVDQQLSKLVIGQTATTDAIAGGHAVGKVHNEVRGDIKRSDCKMLAATLNRDMVKPMIRLNRGERKAYPKIFIGEPDPIDVEKLAKAAQILVPLGMEVNAAKLRQMVGLPDPETGEPVLRVVATQAPPGAATAPFPGSGEAESAARAFLGLLKRPGEAFRAATVGAETTPQPDEAEMIADEALGDWLPLMRPMTDPIAALVAKATSLEELRDGLAGLMATMDTDAIAEQLARLTFGARMAGDAASLAAVDKGGAAGGQ